MRMRRTFLLMALIAAPYSAFSNEPDTVTLHATYLSEPTKWCAADVGLPMIVTADGPDLFIGEFESDPATQVKVRRGASAIERIDVDPVAPSQVRVGRGLDKQSYDRLYPRVDELMPAGRLNAKLQVCDAYWIEASITTSWNVRGPDGAIAYSGDMELRYLQSGHPLFSISGRYPQTIRLGDLRFVVLRKPEFKRTTEAFASPAKEQFQ